MLDGKTGSVERFAEERSVIESPYYELAARRVEFAMQRFLASWVARNVQAVDENIDELDVAVGLWLDLHEEATRAASTGKTVL